MGTNERAESLAYQWALRLVVIVLVTKFIRWFLNPVLVYWRQAKSQSAMELIVEGKSKS